MGGNPATKAERRAAREAELAEKGVSQRERSRRLRAQIKQLSVERIWMMQMYQKLMQMHHRQRLSAEPSAKPNSRRSKRHCRTNGYGVIVAGAAGFFTGCPAGAN